MKNLKEDMKGVLPIILLAIIGVILLVAVAIIILLGWKIVLALALIGGGIYVLIHKDIPLLGAYRFVASIVMFVFGGIIVFLI